MEQESGGGTNCNWRARYGHKRTGTGTGGFGINRMSENHPHYSIIKISQNTVKSSGDLMRLVVTQTLVENHQLTLR